MLADFSTLPNNSRVWVYQCNRKLSDEEVAVILEKTTEFLTQWTAHGANLEAGFEVKYNRFIVIGQIGRAHV